METAETTTNELILRMEERYSKMSKGQRRLADDVTRRASAHDYHIIVIHRT